MKTAEPSNLTNHRETFMRLNKISLAIVAAGLTVAGSSLAATTSSTFQVTANVVAQCNISAANLGFGPVDPLGGNVDASSALTVKCTKNSAYTVGLDAGTTTGATIAARKMANGVDIMNYNLYTDAARASVWGNTTGTWASGTGAGMGTAQTLTVYGRVPTGQTNLAVGSYTETTITATVTY
jgi:spore coat protein U-like protein